MLNTVAQLLNESGNSAENRGWHTCAKYLYALATKVRPNWSSPWYNLGLQAKYRGHWQASLRFNERASTLDPNDEASWWNLGIAATAIRDWSVARKAWAGCGIELEESGEDVSMTPVTACVRLNPQDTGEVVWGKRIDPARIQIWNVPLPNSQRRYLDIVLNDGASSGTRTSGDYEYPVFDELAVWQRSSHSTFQSALTLPNPEAQKRLFELCNENGIGIEDWGTVRFICAQCSRNSVNQNQCSANEIAEGAQNHGFGAMGREILLSILNTWASEEPGRAFSDPHLVLLAA